MKATVFDIKEFALNDGEGIRSTVFFKGCPLRCIWCHNPEGLSSKPEIYVRTNGCRNCGLCKRECSHEDCKPYGRCLHICPVDLISVAGREWDINELYDKLMLGKSIYESTGGGVTFSGGEPLLQSEFLAEILKMLKGKIHTAIETSGFANADTFKKVAENCDFVIMDIKFISDAMHKKYTSVSNEKILKNAEWLKKSNIPHLFRTPLIPNVTDTDENLRAIADFVGDDRIELLSYNTLAPAKYKNVGRSFTLTVNEEDIKLPDTSFFKNVSIRK